MRTHLSFQVLVGMIVLATTACGADEIFRRVTLSPDATLPSGHSEVEGTTLHLHFDGAESLEPSHAFVVWLRTADGTIPAFETGAAGDVQIDLSAAALLAEDVEQILITEELVGTATADVILGSLLLAGELGKELTFGGLATADFEGATGTLELRNKELLLSTDGLPSLPTGYHYGLWMTFPAHGEEDGHGHGHDDANAGEAQHMGELHSGHHESTGDRMMAEASHCRISIESKNGTHAQGHHTVMHGEVVTEAEPGTTPAEDAGGHGDHMH